MSVHQQQQSPRLITFGRKRGRKLRASKQNLMEGLLPSLVIDAQKPDMSAYHEWWLEIGFGSGEHLAMQAETYPHTGIIGCEPYIHGIGNLLHAIDKKQLHNVRLHTEDARELMDKLPDTSICKAFILFPDPWPKARHHKRRLIQQDFLALLARVMRPKATLIIATDHEDYLHWILEHLGQQKDFVWSEVGGQEEEKMNAGARVSTSPPADWVTTKYQAKALREGRIPHWLILERI